MRRLVGVINIPRTWTVANESVDSSTGHVPRVQCIRPTARRSKFGYTTFRPRDAHPERVQLIDADTRCRPILTAPPLDDRQREAPRPRPRGVPSRSLPRPAALLASDPSRFESTSAASTRSRKSRYVSSSRRLGEVRVQARGDVPEPKLHERLDVSYRTVATSAARCCWRSSRTTRCTVRTLADATCLELLVHHARVALRRRHEQLTSLRAGVTVEPPAARPALHLRCCALAHVPAHRTPRHAQLGGDALRAPMPESSLSISSLDISGLLLSSRGGSVLLSRGVSIAVA